MLSKNNTATPNFGAETVLRLSGDAPSFLTYTHPNHHDPKTRTPARIEGHSPTLTYENDWRFRHKLDNKMHALVAVATNLHFITLTVPASTTEAAAAFDHWALIALERLLRRMRKWAKGAYLAHIFAFERCSGSSPLHCHMLVDLPPVHMERFSEDSIRACWRNILLTISSETGVSLFESRDGVNWANHPDVPEVHFRKADHPLAVGAYILKPRDPHTKEAVKIPLNLPDGRQSTPAKWAVASQGLQRAADAVGLTVHFEVDSRKGAFDLIRNELKPLAEKFSCQMSWKEHRDDRDMLLGYRNRIDAGRVQQLKRKLAKYARDKRREPVAQRESLKFDLVISLTLRGDLVFRVRRQRH